MRQALWFGLIALLSVVVTSCGRITINAPPGIGKPAPGASALTDIHAVGDLQSRFSQDAGKPRLVLLVSPT